VLYNPDAKSSLVDFGSVSPLIVNFLSPLSVNAEDLTKVSHPCYYDVAT
jgi:hypothetical protein